jgi:succinoglycan biosynthesis protein ExoW
VTGRPAAPNHIALFVRSRETAAKIAPYQRIHTPILNIMAPTVCVVIPFFQRSPGILSRALASIAGQRGVPNVHVIIVDDSSPVDPAGDIQQSGIDPQAVTVIKQPNAGPGAARNRGLDHVPSGTGFVAFIDSDDEWTPEHLSNALTALDDELDFYISNYREPDATRDEFTVQGKIVLAKHTKLARGKDCYRFEGDMVNQVIVANIIETSTVVFRHARLGSLRFRNDFRNAFEDHLFWISAARASRGFVFSMNVECQYGRGVNIWRGTTFGNDRLMSLLTDERRYYAEVRRLYASTQEQKAVLSSRVRDVRRTVVGEQLHRLRRRMRIDWRALVDYLRLDPAMWVLAWPIAFSIASGRRAA